MMGRCRVYFDDRQFGFLEYSTNGEIFDESIFFSGDACSVRSGDFVEFDVGRDFEGRPKAFNIQRISRDVAPTIARVLQGRVRFYRPEDCWGLINVSTENENKRLFFHGSEVQPASDGLWYEPTRNCVVEFSIAKRNGKECAVDVRIIEWPESEPTFEEQFAAAEELPIDVPETVLSPIPNVVEPSVLAASTRKLSLIEIINRRRSVGEYREH